jgi:hypothetical protein
MATLIVVRRGASETFQHLQTTWAPKLGGDLTLLWDRRTSDRRRDAARWSGASANAERRKPRWRTTSTRRVGETAANTLNGGGPNDDRVSVAAAHQRPGKH